MFSSKIPDVVKVNTDMPSVVFRLRDCGSVSGKSQINISDPNKCELYTIAQTLQKLYHDLLFISHRIIIKYNDVFEYESRR